MFNNKIDEFQRYDNEIYNLEQKEIELKKELQNIETKKESLRMKRRDYGISYFQDVEKRNEILETAKECGFSPTKIKDLEPYLKSWNQDIIDNDIINSFRLVEKYVDERRPYKNNSFYRLSKILQK